MITLHIEGSDAADLLKQIQVIAEGLSESASATAVSDMMLGATAPSKAGRPRKAGALAASGPATGGQENSGSVAAGTPAAGVNQTAAGNAQQAPSPAPVGASTPVDPFSTTPATPSAITLEQVKAKLKELSETKGMNELFNVLEGQGLTGMDRMIKNLKPEQYAAAFEAGVSALAA